jgi:hypothetical protein
LGPRFRYDYDVLGAVEDSAAVEVRPFVESKGEQYHIYRPYVHNSLLNSIPMLLAPLEDRVRALSDKIKALDDLTVIDASAFPEPELPPAGFRAKRAYAQMLISHVSAVTYGKAELTVAPQTGVKKNGAWPLNLEARQKGKDWTYMGETMTGLKRLENVEKLLIDVFSNKVRGRRRGVSRALFIRIRALTQGHDVHRCLGITSRLACGGVGLPSSPVASCVPTGRGAG